MIYITDKIFIDLKIDGNSIPEAFNLISTIALTEGNNALFPTCMLVLNDLSGYLKDELNLVDGNSLSITVGRKADDVGTVTRQYRVFGTKAPAHPAGAQLRIAAIYDAPAFTTANVTEAFKGTTGQLFEKMAKTCLLTYDGPGIKTNDSQIWYNVCKTRAAFAQEVVRRGYINDHSCMGYVLTSLGILKYKNLMELLEKEPKFTLFHNVPEGGARGTAYQIKQARDSSNAGLVNTWQNYGSTRISHSLSGTQAIDEKLEVKTAGNYLPINQQISDTVVKSRVEYTVLDCSNTHPKYERALYQNTRLASLFCEKQSVLVTECTDIQLYDTVYYRQADADLMKAAEPTDIYLVVGKSVYVKGGQSYGERLELVRMSVTNKGAAALATQNPSSLRDGVLPQSFVNPSIFTASNTASLISLVAKTFLGINIPAGVAFALVSQMGKFTNLSNLQLSSLVGIVGGPGLANMADKALAAVKLINNPTGYLASTIGSLSSQYGSIDSLLGNAVSQLSGLNPTQLSQITRGGLLQASLFNPAGAVTSLSTALPMLKTLSQVSSVYSSLDRSLQSNSYYLNQVEPGAQAHLDQFSEHTASLATNYANLCTSTNNIWNKCVSVANNKPIPEDLYNYTEHTKYLNDLAEVSLAQPPGLKNKVTTLDQTTASIAKLLQATDNNRQLLWMYPASPISKTYRYTDDELPSALDSLKLSSSKLPIIASENSVG
jgi:hypothetical protein